MRRRAVINGRFLSQPTTGVQRVAREATRALDALLADDQRVDARWEIELVVPPSARLDLPLRRIAVRRAGPFAGHAWEQLTLPRAVGGDAVLVSFANTGPLAVRRQLVFVHDAAVWALPQTFSRAFRWWYRALLPALAGRVARVATVSAFSRAELLPRLGVAPERLLVIHSGAEHALAAVSDPVALAALSLPTGPFVLAVGGDIAHKQLGVVKAALAHPRCAGLALVVVGGLAAGRVGATVPAAGQPSWAVGRVSDGALRALYERAVGLAFPSSYEGFGLPPVEAMASGCPVVVSTAGALPEVCGDAALYCETGDATTLAGHLARLASDDALRAEMVARGRRRAAEFTWRRHAERVVETLDAITAGDVARAAAA